MFGDFRAEKRLVSVLDSFVTKRYNGDHVTKSRNIRLSS